MKLILAIINDQIAPGLVEHLLNKGIRVTDLPSSGGFLKKGNRTILSGVEDDEVQLVLQIIKEYTQKKKIQKIQEEKADPKKILDEGMATVFVLPVENEVDF